MTWYVLHTKYTIHICTEITIHKKHTYIKKTKKDKKSTGKSVPKNVPNIIIHDPMDIV